MSEGISLQPRSEAEEQCQAGVEACLTEVRRLDDLIASDQARFGASKARTQVLCAEIAGLREQTRAVLAELKTRV